MIILFALILNSIVLLLLFFIYLLLLLLLISPFLTLAKSLLVLRLFANVVGVLLGMHDSVLH